MNKTRIKRRLLAKIEGGKMTATVMCQPCCVSSK